MPDDTRSAEQVATDDESREDVERTGGIWARMSPEQRTQVLARLEDKKRRAQEARARREEEHASLEERVARLEERVSRLED